MNIIELSQLQDLIKAEARPFNPANRCLVGDLQYLNNLHARCTVSAKGKISGRNSRTYRYLLEDISTQARVQHVKGKEGYGLLLCTADRLQLSDVVRDANGNVIKLRHRAGDKKKSERKSDEVTRAFTNDHLHPLDDQCREGIRTGELPLEDLYWKVVSRNILVQVSDAEQKRMNMEGMAKTGPANDQSFGARLKAIGVTSLFVFKPTLKGDWFIC